MRISDWSSDVCSSDLDGAGDGLRLRTRRHAGAAERAGQHRSDGSRDPRTRRRRVKGLDTNVLVRFIVQDDPAQARRAGSFIRNACTARSEEHTSKLQSLMRISYAVFCLKKKKKQHQANKKNNDTRT